MIKLVLVNGTKTDYVLIDTYSTVNFYFALIISQVCRLLRIRYIPILHGGNLERRLKNNPKLSKLIFDNAYKLVSPSNFLKLIFEEYGYKNILYIPNTIEIQDFEFQNRDIDDIKLLWVRSFASIYNPELAVLVLEGLLKEGFVAKLTMVGPEMDGTMKKVKALAVQKGLKIKFTDKLSRKEWHDLSKDHNVFINTTNYDNAPVSIVEAMALGLPVVSTNAGGLPYLIFDGNDGLLVDKNNADEMIKAIVCLKSDSKLKDKLVENARRKAEAFSWENIKPKWRRLLS